jgi:hypothetical protein
MSTHIKDTVQAKKAEVAINDYLIVVPGTDADEVDIAVADDKPYGVAQVKAQLNPIVAGDVIEVAVYGGCYVKLAGSVSAGDSLMPTTGGEALEATTGKWAIGVADEAGVDGDIIAMRIFIHQLA